jgi:hypothetical protein
VSPPKAAGAAAATAPQSPGKAAAAEQSPGKAGKPAKAPRPPKEWEREEAGSYRSNDGRFTLEGDGAGRWFVRDDEETDELGLPRTIGPFPTLVAAKAAAVDHRDRAPEPSPLARELAAASKRGRTKAPDESLADQAAPADKARRGSEREAPAKAAARKPRPAPPSPPSWLESLEARDRDAAARAREVIRDLESLGIEDPGGLARRDLVGNQPEVAKRLLLEAIRRAAAAQLDPKDLVAGARAKARGADDAEALAAYVVARSLAAAVEVLGGMDRLRGGPSRLPGWELVERAPARRRLRLTADDLA